jgi:hypothetical protein
VQEVERTEGLGWALLEVQEELGVGLPAGVVLLEQVGDYGFVEAEDSGGFITV